MSGIFLVREDDSLVEMAETPYDTEELLQSLLAKYPQLLAGDDAESEERSRWLLVTRELTIPDHQEGGGRWSLDHLFLDQEGVPTLVEVKRSTDTRIRREVVGQMLDYAANAVVYWPVDTIRTAFVDRCQADAVSPEEVLREFLGPRDPAEFWNTVKDNLQKRRVRMLFVADVIPVELRRIVEFLNEQMDQAEVMAIEIKQYLGEGKLRSLVPRLIGQTEAARQKKTADGTPLRQWDEESFFSVLKERGDEVGARVARTLLDWGKRCMSYVWWGKGKRYPSFVPVLRLKDDDYYPINVSVGFKIPQIQLGFKHTSVPPFDTPERRRPFLKRLAEIPGIEVEEDWVGRYPSIPLDKFRDPAQLDAFLGVLDWSLEEVRKVNEAAASTSAAAPEGQTDASVVQDGHDPKKSVCLTNDASSDSSPALAER